MAAIDVAAFVIASTLFAAALWARFKMIELNDEVMRLRAELEELKALAVREVIPEEEVVKETPKAEAVIKVEGGKIRISR